MEPIESPPSTPDGRRAGLVAEIGPWRWFRECHLVPSQGWLFRAHLAGKSMRMVPRLGLFAIQSGARPRAISVIVWKRGGGRIRGATQRPKSF
jgi:hypothetical protein